MCRTQWLHGCDRIGIEPTELDKDGKVKDAEYFDEQRVELVEAMEPKVAEASQTDAPGGPRPNPQRGR